jgi:hypothetical protein
MGWWQSIRREQGEMFPYVSRPTAESDLDYGFDPDKYPALADAAREWDRFRRSRLKRLRLKLRSMKG